MMISGFPIRKFLAPEIVMGDGSRHLVGQYANNLSGRKVFLVSDPGVIRTGLVREVAEDLEASGISFVLYDRVSPNPRSAEVMQGARLYQENHCDLVVAIGGGSPMDCAKAVGAVATNRCHVKDLEGVDEISVPGPPLICIPTTAGSSADVSQFAIINDEARKRKFAIISKLMVPDVSLIDPETTLSLPPDITAATGMDALCHAFESYVSNASSPLTDMYAVEATKAISESLPRAYADPENIEHRQKLMLGSMYAGLAFSNASLGLVHAMAHSLGGYLDAPHGECNAQLLGLVVAYNYSQSSEKYHALEKAMDKGEKMPGDLIEKISALNESIDIQPGLAHMGVKEEDIPFLSRNAAQDPCLATNPRMATVEDIERIFHDAL